MKFFADTAEIAEIRELAATGLLDGVTTNPSLIAKAGRNFIETVREICELVEGPVSAEVAAMDEETMLAEGRKLAAIAENVAVKVPLTWAGLKTCRALSQDGIMVNVTLCFSANQALLAAKAGAAFVSPFVGRLDDIGEDGMEPDPRYPHHFRQLPRAWHRGAGRLAPPPAPRHRGCPGRRRCRHRAASRAETDRQPPAHR